MKKLLIWGTGIKARRLCHYLNFDEVEIIGFTDNSGSVCKELWDRYPYFPKTEALNCDYDYIVISSAYYCEITSQLLAEGVDAGKIIQSDNVQFMIPDTLYFFNQIVSDDEKYKIFIDINLWSCSLFC